MRRGASASASPICDAEPEAAPGPLAHSPAGGAKMDPVPLIFSCDTEDYETPAADEAELLWARMFARHGIRACFCVVGEEARALRDRGRRDVLTALAGHEIASHSDMHSAHPTPAEYLEPLSWEEGCGASWRKRGGACATCATCWGSSPAPGASREQLGGGGALRRGAAGDARVLRRPLRVGPRPPPALRRGPAAALPHLLRPLLQRPAGGALRADAGGHGRPSWPNARRRPGRRAGPRGRS